MTLGQVNRQDAETLEHFEVDGVDHFGLKRVILFDTAGNPSTSVGSVYTVPPNTVTKTYVGNQSNVTVLTPQAGNQLQVIGVLITSDDSVFDCKLEFATSGITVQQHFEQGTLGAYIPVNLTGDVDEVLGLTITNSDAQNWFFTINYAEVEP